MGVLYKITILEGEFLVILLLEKRFFSLTSYF